VNPTALAVAIAYGAVVLLALVFLGVIWHSTHRRRRRDEDTTDTRRLAHAEKAWFVIAVACLGALLLATIPFTPYGQGTPSEGAQRVDVEGVQFAWLTDPGEARAGVPVRFRVTARDVNHGFGVYDEDDTLLVQVQAVPDHPTEIEYTFHEPGRYQIVCMEFCGVDHARMLGTFTVRGPA
jgi:cytochrome c oxidase subunit 2